MLKISDSLRDLIANNPWLSFGFHHRLLNLSQLARFLQPLVEARTHKEVQTSAILMNLSRLRARWKEKQPAVNHPGQSFYVDKILIHTGLCSLTLAKTKATHRELNRIFTHIQTRQGFLTFTEGTGEIMVILEQENLEAARNQLSEKPGQIHYRIGAVGVVFSQKYVAVPGLLYRLLQQVSLQNINVIEVTSTATEFNIYLDENDIRLAFDSIYRAFAKRGRTKTQNRSKNPMTI